MDFDFGGSFSGFNVDYGSYYAAQATPALGSGFTPVTNNDYSNAWIETDLHRYIGELLRVEISGVGGNPQPAPAVSTFTGIANTAEFTDGLGGVFAGANALLNGWAAQASAGSAAYIPQVAHTMTAVESELVALGKGSLNVVSGLISVAQMLHSYQQNDLRGAYANVANFAGSMAGAEVGLSLALALGLPLYGTGASVGIVTALGGIAASWGMAKLYDMANHALDDEQMSSVLSSARTAVEQYYWTHPYEPGVRDWNLN